MVLAGPAGAAGCAGCIWAPGCWATDTAIIERKPVKTRQRIRIGLLLFQGSRTRSGRRITGSSAVITRSLFSVKCVFRPGILQNRASKAGHIAQSSYPQQPMKMTSALHFSALELEGETP